MSSIKLVGRIFLEFDIKTLSGLHIGGSDEGISIGGVDKTVIRNSLTGQPYVPGSSLRGKIRSLTEKYTGAEQNNRIGQVTIHTCSDRNKYQTCNVCQIFGVPGEKDFSTPTRLIVRDVNMREKSVEEFRKLRTDLPFTEVKTEVAIDRVTSAASPRQMERVPAGAVFGPAEMVYSLYDGDDCDSRQDLARFKEVITGLQLLEDDYLGGLGSRGSGKVQLEQIKVYVRSTKADAYINRQLVSNKEEGYETLSDLVEDLDALQERIVAAI